MNPTDAAPSRVALLGFSEPHPVVARSAGWRAADFHAPARRPVARRNQRRQKKRQSLLSAVEFAEIPVMPCNSAGCKGPPAYLATGRSRRVDGRCTTPGSFAGPRGSDKPPARRGGAGRGVRPGNAGWFRPLNKRDPLHPRSSGLYNTSTPYPRPLALEGSDRKRREAPFLASKSVRAAARTGR